MTPDGNFPTVAKPNPEYAAVFSLGIEIANRVGSDLVIATDPDSDRVGVMTRTADGSFKTINGNQMHAHAHTQSVSLQQPFSIIYNILAALLT